MVEVRDQVLMTCLPPEAFSFSTRCSRRSSTNGPFFDDLLTLQIPLSSSISTAWRPRALTASLFAAPARADDQIVRFLVLATRALAERWHAPRSHRMAPTLRLALAAAVRMVNRVHGRSTHGRALSTPAVTSCLADGDVRMVDVTDLADRGPAGERYAAHLARGETQHAVRIVLGDELDARAGAASDLPALARLQLDVVQHRAGRDTVSYTHLRAHET